MATLAPAADNAIKIIEGIAKEGAPIGISELSRKLGINKNMIFRIIDTLEQNGWVYCENKDEKKYSLTLRPFYITGMARNRLNLNSASMPLLYELWKETGENVYVGIKNEDKVLYIQNFDGVGIVRIGGTLGARYDLYCSAPGKIILAYSDDEFISDYLNREFTRFTKNTITNKKTMLAEIENIKNQGYATDIEEFGYGIFCIAAPIFDYTHKLCGTIGCSLSSIYYDKDSMLKTILPKIMKTAESISRLLGYTENE